MKPAGASARIQGLSLSLILIAGAASAGGDPKKPPREAKFRKGQIVVQGAPETLEPGVRVLKYLPHANLTVLAVPPGREKAEVAHQKSRGKRSGLNLEVEAFATPNDPFYLAYQWHLSRVQAGAAWDLTDGTGVTVAVLDTGLRPGGADGLGCVAPGYDAVDGDGDPFDGHFHGTHVSGTVGQATGNGVGTAGLAPGACVMPVKVLADDGTGTFADLADGIYWAVNSGARVLNLSLGTPAWAGVRSDPIVDPALDYAYQQGVTVVCAAGNDSVRDNVSYPAIHPTTLAVGASEFLDALASYSNSGDGIDLLAPGGNTDVDLSGDGYGDGVLQETYFNNTWGHFFFQGTSMAAPHVAAAAAMLYAYGTATTPDEVRSALTSTARDLGPAGYDALTGHGLLQVHAALLWGSGSCSDGDGDGWCGSDGDCDDSDPDVHPGAAEVCGDGVDNNCDGQVDEGCAVNQPPAAGFAHACQDLDCSFTDASADADGEIVAWSWSFGDGATSSQQSPSHAYSAAGTYTSTLTVTDDQGASDTAVQTVTVTAPEPKINLRARGNKKRKTVNLNWDGASSSRVDVFRNGALVGSVRNRGKYTDSLDKKASGTFVYAICEEGASVCSNEDAVSF